MACPHPPLLLFFAHEGSGWEGSLPPTGLGKAEQWEDDDGGPPPDCCPQGSNLGHRLQNGISTLIQTSTQQEETDTSNHNLLMTETYSSSPAYLKAPCAVKAPTPLPAGYQQNKRDFSSCTGPPPLPGSAPVSFPQHMSCSSTWERTISPQTLLLFQTNNSNNKTVRVKDPTQGQTLSQAPFMLPESELMVREFEVAKKIGGQSALVFKGPRKDNNNNNNNNNNNTVTHLTEIIPTVTLSSAARIPCGMGTSPGHRPALQATQVTEITLGKAKGAVTETVATCRETGEKGSDGDLEFMGDNRRMVISRNVVWVEQDEGKPPLSEPVTVVPASW
ncbi:hypothetical protein Q8A73_018402 [Channa argus]|nr:hypothetical protein Q8A73_018402 [Channa argus]